MKIKDFTDKYSLSPSYPFVAHNDGRISSSLMRKLPGAKPEINETAVLRRHDFKTQIQVENQQLYFQVTELYTDAYVTRYMTSLTKKAKTNWYMWITRTLWSEPQDSLLNRKVNKIQWQFNKAM